FELRSLGKERGASVEAGVVERSSDLLERKPELASNEDLLEAKEVSFAVQPIPGRAPRAGREEPDVVVVMKRPDRDPGERRELLDQELLSSLHGPYSAP